MTARGKIPDTRGINRARRKAPLALAFALVALALPIPSRAQLFSDRPPPIPPALVPDVPSGGAISLAPPSGPASAPVLPPPLSQPPVSAVTSPPVASTPGQAVLSLTARYGKDLPVINGGLVWRIVSDRPDESGTFKLLREERGAPPNIVLPPGSYVVHVPPGLVSAVSPVTLKADTFKESFTLPAGGLRIE